MEWIYFLLLGSIILSFFVLLNNGATEVREKQGRFGLGGLNAMSWYNRRNHCWRGLNSQGCSTDHQIYGF